MSGADRLEDGFPHGTPDGFKAGCRGGWCPAGNDHGLSCKRAKQLAAGDYRYQRLVKAGLSPFEVAQELGLVPETHEPPKKQAVVPEGDTEDEEEIVVKQQEPTPKDVAPKKPASSQKAVRPKRKAPAGPSQSAVRAWALEQGVPVNPRGMVRREVVDQYLAAHSAPEPAAAEKPARTLKPMKPAVQPPALSEPVENELAAVSTALAGATTAPREGDRVKDAGEFAARWNGLTSEQRDEWVRHMSDAADQSIDCTLQAHDGLLVELAAARAERDTAQAALDFTLRKWSAERAQRDAQTRLVRELAHQVVVGEEERRADAELLASMDRALADAQAAPVAVPWWKRAAS